MIRAISRLAFILSLSLAALSATAQQTSMEYLSKQFPKLTDLFKEELGQTHTHYIIAVDVSGSMVKYNDVVTPVLQAFAMALPEGEQISVIPFGAEAKTNTPGLCLAIQGDEQRHTIHKALSSLYVNDSHTPEFKRNTDINKAVAAINKTILNNKDIDMNVVVILTDFLNDLPGKGEVKLTQEDLQTLSADFNNLTDNTYTRVVAMRLPKAGSGAGYCLDQLSDNVFNNQTDIRRFETVDVISDPTAIDSWFKQLSRDIMTEKLRGVIRLYNKREISPDLTTDVDIDGNLKASISWKPNKMYTQLNFGEMSTMPGSEFYFRNKEQKDTTMTGDKVLELGQIRHKNWGFHNFDEDLSLALDLPTDFDNELQTLSIEKPFSNTTVHASGRIWTFLLPFMTTCIIAALLLLYLLCIIKASRRNSKEKFKGKVDIMDENGQFIQNSPITIRPTNSFKIGCNGSGSCRVSDVKWNIEVTKQKSNIFLPWKKPRFKCLGNAMAKARNSSLAYIGRYSNQSTAVTFKCLDNNRQIINSVRIKLS